MTKNKMKNKTNMVTIGVIILLIIVTFNLFSTFGLNSSLDHKINEVKEIAKPAELEIISLSAPCSDCVDVTKIVSTIKEANVKILSEKSFSINSESAKKLIAKYGIKKLPTVIVSGEIEKTSIQSFTKVGNVLLFNHKNPPFIDSLTGKIKGKVSTIVIEDTRCTECEDLTKFVTNIKNQGIFVEKEEVLISSTKKAKELIQSLGVKKLPVLLISEEIEEYPLAQNMQESGLVLTNGYYAIESMAPYVEVKTGKIRGFVTLTLLGDKSCTTCYDVNIHKQFFNQMALAINEVKKIDINSAQGKELRAKYDLKKIPTAILTGDLDAYEKFDEIVWKNLGTVEKDESHVLRNVELLGLPYKDLTTNQVITPTQK